MSVSALAAAALVSDPDVAVKDIDRVALAATDHGGSKFMYQTKVPQRGDLIHSRN